ncbi:folate-binding protein [Acidobacteria bacterium AB60]|nr:folate-binding protein [Acidobacteria bacterium AB60]
MPVPLRYSMSDIALAASPTATPLAAWLASGEIHPETTVYRGVITPQELDARQTETEALVFGAAVHDMGWLRRVQVKGSDRFRWLSGMVTNAVNELAGNGGAWNLVLNAQGRIQGELSVWRSGPQTYGSGPGSQAGSDDDTLEMEIAADQQEKLLTHFDKFIIMDDVELTPRGGETALGLTGPKAGEVLARLGLPVLRDPMTHARAEFNGMSLRIRREYGVLGEHYVIWTSLHSMPKMWKFLMTGGALPVGVAAVESFRVAEGIPLYGVDMLERDLPQETSQMRTLHFSKGCYLGQEIVERIRSRGNVHRHLRQIEIDGPLPASGTELKLDGAAVGNVTSAAELPLPRGTRRVALAMVRGEAEAKQQPLGYETGEGAGTARMVASTPAV